MPAAPSWWAVGVRQGSCLHTRWEPGLAWDPRVRGGPWATVHVPALLLEGSCRYTRKGFPEEAAFGSDCCERLEEGVFPGSRNGRAETELGALGQPASCVVRLSLIHISEPTRPY